MEASKVVIVKPLTPWARAIVDEHGKIFQVRNRIEDRLFLVDPDVTSLKEASFGVWVRQIDAVIEAVKD